MHGGADVTVVHPRFADKDRLAFDDRPTHEGFLAGLAAAGLVYAAADPLPFDEDLDVEADVLLAWEESL